MAQNAQSREALLLPEAEGAPRGKGRRAPTSGGRYYLRRRNSARVMAVAMATFRLSLVSASLG